MEKRFTGKVAFITGGTGELGRKVVESFYGEGAKVAATYRSEDRVPSLPSSLWGDRKGILLIKADVTQEAEVQSAFDGTVNAFGRLDYLVNVVGGYMPKTPIAELRTADWNRMFDVNLKSAFLCSKNALRVMQRKGRGRIINISAMAGLNPSAGRGAYGISKAGVAVLTEITADEVKGSGITANAIAPSIIATEANIKSSPGEDYSSWVQPNEIADLILFLCSEEAKSINGAVIRITGGV
jgi:NAD(P)-dependent dehydrogenase (short-subunit alcohol dehydrogenase family)